MSDQDCTSHIKSLQREEGGWKLIAQLVFDLKALSSTITKRTILVFDHLAGHRANHAKLEF